MERGLTQAQLGRSAGVTRAYICVIEAGRVAPRVSPQKLSRLAVALSVPEEDLLNHAGFLPEGYRVVRERGADEREFEDLRAAGYPSLDAEAREEIRQLVLWRAHRSRDGKAD